MGKSGFEEYVKRLEDYMKTGKVNEISLAEASTYLNVSPNYARIVMQAVAVRNGWLYKRGKLIVTGEA